MQSRSDSFEQTREIGCSFAQSLDFPTSVGLIGPLGAGKTCFIQGMTSGLTVNPDAYVTSPTFTLINEYESPIVPIYHFDLYRLSRFEELLDIGFEEYLASGLCVIEWADRFSELESLLQHWVRITHDGLDSREILIY
jgi:tRNA threonylcarbamoyladenosine biosynthesis protein TsaE